MFDLDKVSLKRKIIACIIVSLPAIYYVLTNPKFSSLGILETAFKCCLYCGAFCLAIAMFAGILSLPFLIIYGLVLLIGKLLLGTNPENAIDGLGTIGYISIGITVIVLYYLAFGGKIPRLIW